MYVEKRRSYKKFVRLTLMKLTPVITLVNARVQIRSIYLHKIQFDLLAHFCDPFVDPKREKFKTIFEETILSKLF